MSDNGKPFLPFGKVVGVYEKIPRGLTEARLFAAFQSMFGIPPGVIRTPFKRILREVIEEEYPHFRCSSARAVLDGLVPGIPKPVDRIHPVWVKRVRAALYLLDVFETVCHRYIESQIAAQATETRHAVAAVRKSVGSSKVPRLLEAVYRLEKHEREKRQGGKKGEAKKKKAEVPV